MLTVPVLLKGKGPQLISDTVINNKIDWRKKHLQTISQNYGKSPYFSEMFPMIEEIYANQEESLSSLNANVIQVVCKYLDIERKFVLSSTFPEMSHLKSTDLLVHLCKELGGTTYISGIGGKKYMEMDTFVENNVDVSFIEYVASPYQQRYGEFISNLSIMDLLFNEGLHSVQILRKSIKL